MNAWRAIQALGPVDLKSIQRDALLRWMALSPLLIGLAIRWVIPALAERIREQFGFDVSPYYGLLMSILVAVVALMFGMIIGFLLLDQRDDRTLIALQVTPLSLNGYFAYRIAMPILISILGVILVVPLSGLVQIRPASLLWVSVAAAPQAPLFALALASLAQNKVQGFALSKATGVLFVAPLIAYFVPAGWQLAFGLVPTYWPAKLFWVLQEGAPYAWAYLAAGLLYQAFLIGLLLRYFNRIMER